MTAPGYMTGFTFQTEWVEKRGFLLVLAFFLGGLGCGLYLVSLYLNFYAGMVTGFLIVLIGKSGSHFLYLGKPWRFWRGFWKPQNSWISRALAAIVVFVVAAGLQLAPTLPIFSWLPWTMDNLVLEVFAIIGALVLIVYTGFALGVVKAIPFWNSPLMPVLFIAYSLLGGTGLATGMIAGMKSNINIQSVEVITTWLLIVVAVMLGTYLWVTYDSTPAARKSVIELVKGRVSPYFLIGIVVLGLVIPLAVASYALVSEVSPVVIVAASACELIGGFSMRYSILKAGVYAPLI